MYNLYILLLAIALIANWVLIIILYKRRQKSIATVSLIIFLLLISIWFTPNLLMNALHAQGPFFEVLSKVSALGYVFVPAAFVTFSLANGLCRDYLQRFLYWILVLVPSIFFLYLSWTTNLIGVHDYHQARLYSWGYEMPTGKFWFPYTVWFDAVILAGLFILWKNYLLLDDKVKKRQALYIILIALCPLVIGTLTLAILPMFDIFVMPVGVVILNMTIIAGVAFVYKFGWFIVTPLSVLSSLNYAIITVDRSGSILQMNPYSERLIREKATQVTGKNISKILTVKNTNNNISHLKQLLKPVIDRGRSMTFDSYTVVTTKRKAFPSTISITPIYDKKTIIGANIFMRDSRKEQEREKKKDDFLNMLSHELKTPVASIKAYNQLLLRQLPKDSDKKRQISLKMANEIDRLAKLIQDSLELAQLQSGKLRLDKEFFGVDDFIADVVQTLGVTYPHWKISVEGWCNCVVFADKNKIEQVLINLINNAIKFSPQNKEIIVHVSSDKHYATIGVQDFGKGITPRYQKKIFERFFQVERTVKERTGLGMGLYIASSIVKAHDGKMRVDSKVEKGSTFYFSLPISS